MSAVVQIHKRPSPSVMTDAELWRRELEAGPRRSLLARLITRLRPTQH